LYLPSFAEYLFPSLFPLTSFLVELSLPNLDANSLFVYFQACTSLRRLSIASLTPASTPSLCLLLVLPQSLSYLKFGEIVGSLAGHYDWSSLGSEIDLFSKLGETLEKMKGSHSLRVIEIGKGKWFLPEHQRKFATLEAEVEVGEIDNSRTEEEVSLSSRVRIVDVATR
jgi:hypothetical protein